MQILPENILRCMSAADRRKYAEGQMTEVEALDRYCKRQEKELHKEFESWCLLHRDYLDYSHARMDKPTTTEVGLLDFHVWKAKAHCFVEFKTEHGRLSNAQKAFIARQDKLGVPTLVTSSFVQATEFVRKNLYDGSPPWSLLINLLGQPEAL